MPTLEVEALYGRQRMLLDVTQANLQVIQQELAKRAQAAQQQLTQPPPEPTQNEQ